MLALLEDDVEPPCEDALLEPDAFAEGVLLTTVFTVFGEEDPVCPEESSDKEEPSFLEVCVLASRLLYSCLRADEVPLFSGDCDAAEDEA